MQSKDVLKAALKDFNGTLICVSHDRDFLDGLVEKVYEFSGGLVREHIGGIYDFLRTKKIGNLQELEKRDLKESKEAKDSKDSSSKLDYAEQKAQAAAKRKKNKQIAETEAEIARIEEEQAHMEALLSNPESQTPENFQKYESLKHQIEQKLYEWEILSES
jgi:ATP-binding cassette subfamily F protein 3